MHIANPAACTVNEETEVAKNLNANNLEHVARQPYNYVLDTHI